MAKYFVNSKANVRDFFAPILKRRKAQGIKISSGTILCGNGIEFYFVKDNFT